MADQHERLQDALGYRFRDIELLISALVHRSYLNERRATHGSNERLEFLGDSVLAVVTADRLYRRFPHSSEGELTLARARLVNRQTLATAARRLELGDALLVAKDVRIRGGHQLDAKLADAFEAVLGAAYLDGGVAAAEAIVDGALGPELEMVHPRDDHRDAKSRLQELIQARHRQTPLYATVEAPPGGGAFRIEVRLDDRVLGVGTGRSKAEAEREAAERALLAIETAGG